MTLNIDKKAIIHYFLLYILLMFQGSIMFRVLNDIIVVLVFFIGLIFLISLMVKKINVYSIFIILLFTLLLLQSIYTAGSLAFQSIISICSRFLIAFIAYFFDKEKFVQRYITIIIHMGILSILAFIIQTIGLDLLKSILNNRVFLSHIGYTSYYGGLIFAFQEGLHKNIGIYLEPGLYQIVLNSCLYCLLFRPRTLRISRDRQIAYVLILLVCVITTQSTSGLIGAIVLLIVFVFFKKKEIGSKMTIYTMIVIPMLFILVFFVLSTFLGNSYIKTTIIDKVISTDGSIDLSQSTGRSRIVSMKADLKIVFENPLGIGWTEYKRIWKTYLSESISDVSSCVGLTYTLAALGFIITSYIVGFYFFSAWRHRSGIASYIAFVFLFLNTSLGQPQIWYPAIIVLVLVDNEFIVCDKDSDESRFTRKLSYKGE